MKGKKKFIITIVMLLLLVFTLTACESKAQKDFDEKVNTANKIVENQQEKIDDVNEKQEENSKQLEELDD